MTSPQPPLPILVALTGASGIIYGVRLVQTLTRQGVPVDLILSDGARRVIQAEMGLSAPRAADTAAFLGLDSEQAARLRTFPLRDIGALPASGTYKTRAMIVCPASMRTCAAIAHGFSDNLITRAAEVTLKERRPLVLVPRETPLSTIHLSNFLTLAQAGAILLPAMPGFYHQPKTINDLVDFLVMKILDIVGLPHNFPHAWNPDSAGGES